MTSPGRKFITQGCYATIPCHFDRSEEVHTANISAKPSGNWVSDTSCINQQVWKKWDTSSIISPGRHDKTAVLWPTLCQATKQRLKNTSRLPMSSSGKMYCGDERWAKYFVLFLIVCGFLSEPLKNGQRQQQCHFTSKRLPSQLKNRDIFDCKESRGSERISQNMQEIHNFRFESWTKMQLCLQRAVSLSLPQTGCIIVHYLADIMDQTKKKKTSKIARKVDRTFWFKNKEGNAINLHFAFQPEGSAGQKCWQKEHKCSLYTLA